MQCGFDREEVSRDMLPLPSSFAATPFEIRPCTQASKSDPQPSEITFGGRKRRPVKRKDENVAVTSQPTAAQAAALKQLELHIIDFLKGPPAPEKDSNEMMHRTKLDYQQQEVKFPEPVTWKQLEPALPPAESAGRVGAADLAEGLAKQWLTDFHRCLLDETECQLHLLTVRYGSSPKTNAVDGCAKRGLFTFLRPTQVFHAGGAPVLNGLFGVKKRGKVVGATGAPVLRININALPSSAYQMVLTGDIRALPSHGQWSGIQVDDQNG